MAGAACKILLNQMTRSIVKALETILVNPETPGPVQLKEPTRLRLLQQLADIDVISYCGGEINVCSSVSGIVQELYSLGVFTDEVWSVLRHPANAFVPSD